MALELLTETAFVGHLTPQATAIVSQSYDLCSISVPDARREILDILEHDGYIERRDDGYRFVSRLLRDWWKAHYGFGYVRAANRGVRV